MGGGEMKVIKWKIREIKFKCYLLYCSTSGTLHTPLKFVIDGGFILCITFVSRYHHHSITLLTALIKSFWSYFKILFPGDAISEQKQIKKSEHTIQVTNNDLKNETWKLRNFNNAY